ncbi:MAG: hypothetical protein WDN69_17270 [Aliidongia sp.]
MKPVVLAGTCLLALASAAEAADLSPSAWPQADRERAEQTEAQRWDPETARSAAGTDGVISATVSPIAVQAGLQALKQGGTAADAAATVALTQITTQLGSVVSYAGIMTLLYYDAKTGKVYSLDAGYNSYRGETDPKSIRSAIWACSISAARRPSAAPRGAKRWYRASWPGPRPCMTGSASCPSTRCSSRHSGMPSMA